MEEITNPLETPSTPSAELASVEPAAEELITSPTPEEVVHPVEEEPKEPKRASKSSKSSLKEKQSKESIEAAIQEKLSKRSDEGEVDPFVPSTQLQNEVKQVAQEAGFHLTRGTEAGAALMARARRRPHS